MAGKKAEKVKILRNVQTVREKNPYPRRYRLLVSLGDAKGLEAADQIGIAARLLGRHSPSCPSGRRCRRRSLSLAAVEDHRAPVDPDARLTDCERLPLQVRVKHRPASAE